MTENDGRASDFQSGSYLSDSSILSSAGTKFDGEIGSNLKSPLQVSHLRSMEIDANSSGNPEIEFAWNQVSRMTLQIRLMSTHGFPSSLVEGYVISNPETKTDLIRNSLTVILSGTSKVQIPIPSPSNPPIQKNDTLAFLTLTQNPYSHLPPTAISTFLEPNDHSYFQLRFPEDASFTTIEANTATSPRVLDLPAPQSLPPSGDFGNGNIVEYAVDVSVLSEKTGERTTTRIPISFSPTREELEPDVNFIQVVQTAPLQTGPLDNRTIRLSLDIPTTIVQSSTFPLIFRLVDLLSFPSAPSSPPAKVYLRSTRIELLHTTIAWSSDNHGHRSTVAHTLATFTSPPNSNEINNRSLEITKLPYSLEPLLNHPTIPTAHPPSFTCANLERKYGLRIRVTVRVEEQGSEAGFKGQEQEVEVVFGVDDVRVLPAEAHAVAKKRKRDLFRRNPLEERGIDDD